MSYNNSKYILTDNGLLDGVLSDLKDEKMDKSMSNGDPDGVASFLVSNGIITQKIEMVNAITPSISLDNYNVLYIITSPLETVDINGVFFSHINNNITILNSKKDNKPLVVTSSQASGSDVYLDSAGDNIDIITLEAGEIVTLTRFGVDLLNQEIDITLRETFRSNIQTTATPVVGVDINGFNNIQLNKYRTGATAQIPQVDMNGANTVGNPYYYELVAGDAVVIPIGSPVYGDPIPLANDIPFTITELSYTSSIEFSNDIKASYVKAEIYLASDLNNALVATNEFTIRGTGGNAIEPFNESILLEPSDYICRFSSLRADQFMSGADGLVYAKLHQYGVNETKKTIALLEDIPQLSSSIFSATLTAPVASSKIPLSTNVTNVVSSGITVNADSLVIQKAGNYIISISALPNDNAAGDIKLHINVNGVSKAYLYAPPPSGKTTTATVSTAQILAIGDIIDFEVTTPRGIYSSDNEYCTLYCQQV